VLIVSLYGGQVDLDLDCVLYGEIAYTPFDTLMLGGQAFGPRPVWINAALFVINLLLVALLFKQFKICAFDAAMAAAVGVNVTAMHYLLMAMVSVTAVGAFESVGAILVVALIIVPPAAAYLLADRLEWMMAIAVGIGVISSLLGYLLARALDASIAGSIALVCGAFFLAAYVFSPSHGVLSRRLARLKLSRRVAEEDALLWATRRLERGAEPVFTAGELQGALMMIPGAAKSAVRRLTRSGMMAPEGDGFVLSATGGEAAAALLRRHRLYESYLEETGLPADHIHGPTDRAEHYISPAIAELVEEVVGEQDTDPHGKPIPKRELAQNT
jgi:Mn-dependent DtxR family transcriptional regulator